MTQMIRLIVTIFLLLTSFSLHAIQDLNVKSDTTFFSWGQGHVSITLFLYKGIGRFDYVFRDDLWTHVTSGKFELIGDTLRLISDDQNLPKTNWNIDQPIVVERDGSNNQDGKEIVFMSTSYDTLQNFKGDFVYGDNDSCWVEISKDSFLYFVYQVKDCAISSYEVYIPYGMLYPEVVYFLNKMIILKSDKLLFMNGILLKKIPLVSSLDAEKHKRVRCRCKFFR